jgi:hypothetical protein
LGAYERKLGIDYDYLRWHTGKEYQPWTQPVVAYDLGIRWDRIPSAREVLMLVDREEISRGLTEGLGYKEIACRVGRDPSVISREVARHGGWSAYRAVLWMRQRE